MHLAITCAPEGPLNQLPVFSTKSVEYNFTYPNWNSTENTNGAVIAYKCLDTYAFSDKEISKSFQCKQDGNKGVWVADQPSGWVGCLGILLSFCSYDHEDHKNKFSLCMEIFIIFSITKLSFPPPANVKNWHCFEFI